MAVQYVFVKVTGTTAVVDQLMNDDIYDAGGAGTIGYYQCIDVGSAAGEKLSRADMKEIFDKEKEIWGDQTSRSTFLYWNSVQNCFVINFCGWASNNIAETRTDGSEHTDGIYLRECDLQPSSFSSATFKTFGTLTDSQGTKIKLVDKKHNNISNEGANQCITRGLSISGDKVPDQNSTRTTSYFLSSRSIIPFNNVMFFKNNKSLYANNTLSQLSTRKDFQVSKIKNNETGIGREFGRHFIAPTKTQFDPDSITGALPSGSLVSAITSYGSRYESGSAADSICIDSTNLSQMHTPTGGNSDASITQISHVPNTGDDPFGLKAGGKSVNCTFWIPTLQGATATSKSDNSRVMRFSVCSNSYGGRIGIGAFHRNFSYTNANETNLEEFVSDENHRVCLFVKNSESPHSFKYSWTQPLTLTFKYRNSPSVYFIQSGIQTNMFSGVHNKIIGDYGSEWLQLDPMNIIQEFKLDYSSTGATDGSSTLNPARTKSGLYFKSSTSQRYWYNARLGGSDDIDYVHGNSYSSTTAVSSDSFSIGETPYSFASVSAVYPASG